MTAADPGVSTFPTRRSRRRRRSPVALVGAGLAGALMVAAVSALATNDPLEGATGSAFDLDPTREPAPSQVGEGAAVPEPDSSTGAGSVGSSAGGEGGVASSAPRSSPATVSPTAPVPRGTTPSPPTAPAPAEQAPAVVSPVLQFLALGGRVGMPFVCSLAISAVGPALTDPAVAAVAGQIVSSCATAANQGADFLLQLDSDLAALAAVNPAVQPVLDALAATLEDAADMPFGGSLVQLAALVRFFRG